MITLRTLFCLQIISNNMQNPIQIMPYVKEVNSRLIFNIFHKVAYYILVAVFVVSGISKLYNPFDILESMRLALPLPTLVLIAFVAFIAIFETLLGLFLMLRIKVKQNLIVAAVLSLFFFIYTLFCFYQGVPGETGFFGGFISCTFDFSLVIKNAVFVLLAVLLLITEIELPD